MDENSENPQGAATRQGSRQSKARTSLVERAAGKIIADTGRAAAGAALAPAPERAPTAPPLPPGDSHLQPAPDTAQAETATSFIEQAEAAPEAAAEPLLPQGDAERPAEAASSEPSRKDGRRSKLVKIDLEALEARKILTPLTKRNRTVEEFRLIKRLVLSRRWDEGDAPGNTILVTSALPAEGKTTTAVNLAMSIAAEEDLRVVLVDADFIKPDALRQLGVSSDKGLIDVLQNPRMDISDVILRTNVEKLSLIPSGRLHDRCTELLASSRMDDLIAELANRYEDRILIFDSPPVLATTESVALASHMGQIVFVVQAGRTKRESVLSAVELIGGHGNIGMVLNRTKARLGSTEFGSYYGAGYYYYGHEK